ncbi:MurR/RpiR family transcriptional regulator [Aerolutibacter ruishenii]|uniref:MurR/RpiR family transcriptional regulator n=1 Tax=Aerolutibacter ruishenii TaxID=686800 RepID=UPI00119F681C|nr:MurR/RpiR family transcriptional regulator [Lysobacter ruishenii]
MSPLLKIRAERDQMSAIERRIADFILDNAHLLRDYSSQHLANALGISQSSVVKFSQKLGFKGYPDLKYSIGQALARGDAEPATPLATPPPDNDPQAALAGRLWQLKATAEAETRLINPAERIDEVAAAVQGAGKVFVIGLGEDGIPARALATRLSMLGVLTVHYVDAVLMQAGIASAAPGDVLLVFSERGRQPVLCQISRRFHEHGGRVVSVTRHTPNPLRALADIALLVSAHDEARHVEPLLYQSALQHLLDLIFLMVCEASTERQRWYDSNAEHMHALED